MTKAKLKFKKLKDDVKLPSYANPGDAGMDIYSLEDKVLKPGERYAFQVGFTTEFSDDFVVLIKDKSGLAAKSGITILAGVIDSGYRGEYGIVMLNTGDQPHEVRQGDKIAQMLIMPLVTAEIEEDLNLGDSERGKGGFGSTGK
ncbi:MAG: dUTP diphosphatase [bacterium]